MDIIKSEEKKLQSHKDYINQRIPNSECNFFVNGYCYPAKKQVDFLCNFQWGGGFPNVNWREQLSCPETGLNNRMRFSIHLIDSFLNLSTNSDLYIMEQATPLFRYLSGEHPNIIGSEFLGDALALGSVDRHNIRNEDSTALTFPNDSFDAILSYDVFEHVPNFKLAFKESYRTLKNGGRLLFSAPFNSNSEKNQIRAILKKNGNIEHLMTPEFHSDPIGGGEGILCYQHFGWEILDDLKLAGFKDAFAIVGWSEELCYFTPQIQFLAIK